MSAIQDDINAIRRAVYGKDVREAIADGIEQCYTDVSSAKTRADDAIERISGDITGIVDDWLDEHPEATTTVQDGAITKAKLASSLTPYVVKDFITPEMYGAKADGATDDTQAIIDAFNACKTTGKYLLCPAKRYKTTESCILNYELYEFDVYILGMVDYIEFVGAPSKMSSMQIKVRKATTVTFKNFKGISAFVANATTLKVCADTSQGSAYNNFRGGSANNLVVEGLASGAWVNENKFYDFRVINLSIIGNGYLNNNNRFYDVVLESGTGTITLNGAHSNYIQMRGESMPSKVLSNQSNNIIERTYTGNMGNIPEPIYDGNYSFTAFSHHKYMSMLEIFRLDKYNMPLDDERNIKITSWKNIVMLYIRMGSAMSVNVNSSGLFRFNYRIYDSEFNNITTSDPNTCGALSAGPTYGISPSDNEPQWSISSNTKMCRINCYDSDPTHWIRLSFNAGNAAFVAPCFSVFLRALTVPEYFIGSSVLDPAT